MQGPKLQSARLAWLHLDIHRPKVANAVQQYQMECERVPPKLCLRASIYLSTLKVKTTRCGVSPLRRNGQSSHSMGFAVENVYGRTFRFFQLNVRLEILSRVCLALSPHLTMHPELAASGWQLPGSTQCHKFKENKVKLRQSWQPHVELQLQGQSCWK